MCWLLILLIKYKFSIFLEKSKKKNHDKKLDRNTKELIFCWVLISLFKYKLVGHCNKAWIFSQGRGKPWKSRGYDNIL